MKRLTVYAGIFVFAIGACFYANWYHSQIGFLIGGLVWIASFMLIPIAGSIESASKEASEARRMQKGLPILPPPKGEKFFGMAIYLMLATAIVLFVLGFRLIGYLYPHAD